MRHSIGQVVDLIMNIGRDNASAIFGDRYAIAVDNHDTGTHVSIYALLGDERLMVWDYHRWKSSQYEFNNRDKVLGLQHPGPWADQIDDALDRVACAIKARDEARAQRAAKEYESKELEAARKIKRFAEAFGKAEA